MHAAQKLVFANSVDYARHTGGWAYNSRVMREVRSFGWNVTPLDLPAGFPRPDAPAVAQAEALFAGVPNGAIVTADQICLSPLASVVAREAARLRFVMIFHHPIAKEEGLPSPERKRFAALEREALAACRLVVATSPTTSAELAADYDVASDRIVVAPPGIDPMPLAVASLSDVPRLLSVGAVIERKGYHVLIDALAALRDRPWQLDIVGDLDRAAPYVDSLHAMIGAAGLGGRIVLRGGLDADELEACWRSANAYVAASFHEGYGMAVAEAIARGLPTVTTRAGAVGDWLAPGAAFFVPNGDADALVRALTRVLDEPALRAELRATALVEARRLPSWTDTARKIAARLAAL